MTLLRLLGYAVGAVMLAGFVLGAIAGWFARGLAERVRAGRGSGFEPERPVPMQGTPDAESACAIDPPAAAPSSRPGLDPVMVEEQLRILREIRAGPETIAAGERVLAEARRGRAISSGVDLAPGPDRSERVGAYTAEPCPGCGMHACRGTGTACQTAIKGLNTRSN